MTRVAISARRAGAGQLSVPCVGSFHLLRAFGLIVCIERLR